MYNISSRLVYPYTDETMLSWLYRGKQTCSNCFCEASRLVMKWRLDSYAYDVDFMLSSSRVSQLAKVLDIPRHVVKGVSRSNSSLLIDKVFLRNCYCPLCLMEDIYNGGLPGWRKSWCYAWVVACPWHRVRLESIFGNASCFDFGVAWYAFSELCSSSDLESLDKDHDSWRSLRRISWYGIATVPSPLSSLFDIMCISALKVQHAIAKSIRCQDICYLRFFSDVFKLLLRSASGRDDYRCYAMRVLGSHLFIRGDESRPSIRSCAGCLDGGFVFQKVTTRMLALVLFGVLSDIIKGQELGRLIDRSAEVGIRFPINAGEVKKNALASAFFDYSSEMKVRSAGWGKYNFLWDSIEIR